jgi:type II secretory pathway component PulF
MHVISTIGAGMRQNLPLTAALEAAAANQKDVHATTLRRISKWLVQGYSLGEAVRRGYPKCPADVVATIAAAEKVNQLPQAIKSIEENLLERLDASRRVEPVSPAYPAVVLLIAFSLMMFLMMKIVPVFSIVLEDLSEGKMGLPKSTEILFALTNSLFENQWLLAVLLVVFPVIIYMIIYARLRVRRPEKVYLISGLTDFIKWHLPVMHWFEFNYSMLRLVSLLRVSLNAGCTVNDAIRNSLGLNVNNRFRKRMSRWLERIERGEDISAAAQKSGMGNALVWAFDAEVNQGNTPEILEMLEEFYRSNYSYRINLARYILEPCMVLMLGLVVGFIVYAMFSPIVAMIHYAADMATP